MNMMQNSPLLVAQANPVKNGAAFKQPSEMAEKTIEGKSFKQLLSKQVKQEAAKPAEHQANQAEASTKATPTGLADTAAEVVDAQVVDAQVLASTVTAKAIEDVTDGDVILATPSSDDAPLAALPSNAQEALADTAPFSLANIMATIQSNPMSKQVNVVPDTRVDAEVSKAKQPLADLDLAAAVKGDVGVEKGKVADGLVGLAKTDSSQFAQYLDGGKNGPLVKEMSVSQPVVNALDASALSTMPVQTAIKPFVQAMPAAEQVGFSNLIQAAPGKMGWNEAIGQKVVWMVGAAEQSATLTLNPKDLGPLQVIIHVNNEKADATFITENPEVRKALEDGMSSLRQSMGQAGVELGQANVNTSKQQQAFQQSNQMQLGQQNTANPTEQTAAELGSSPVVTRESNGLVDTFA